MSGRPRRVEPADEWEQIELLCAWPEQRDSRKGTDRRCQEPTLPAFRTRVFGSS